MPLLVPVRLGPGRSGRGDDDDEEAGTGAGGVESVLARRLVWRSRVRDGGVSPTAAAGSTGRDGVADVRAAEEQAALADVEAAGGEEAAGLQRAPVLLQGAQPPDERGDRTYAAAPRASG